MSGLDDFFVRALVAGLAIALLTGPLGCHIVWRRMAYFGETISHAAILGVALALMMQVDQTIGVFLVAATVSLALVLLQQNRALPTDSLLGILAHGSLALGLVIVSMMKGVRLDLMSVLFGDILSVSRFDLAVIAAVVIVVLPVLIFMWRPLVAASVHPELAQAEGLSPSAYRIAFLLLMAATVAVAMKVIGVLLLTAMLIIPAASARRFAQSPEQMALLSAGFGMLAMAGGLYASLTMDTPSGPSVVVVGMLLFLAIQLRPRGAL